MSQLELSTISTNQKIMAEESVSISLDEGAELPGNLPNLEKMLREYFIQNQFNLTLDLEKISLPPPRFIALLIEITSEARRMGGDIKLINLKSSIRNNLITFSPRTYLSIDTSEQYALYDFDETLYPPVELDSSEKKVSTISITDDRYLKQYVSKQPIDTTTTALTQELIELARDTIRVPSKITHLYEICDFVLERAEKAGFDVRERGKIKVTVYEACLNIIEHAYFSNPDHWITVYVGYNNKKFIIILQDKGESFKFDPTRSYNVEQAVKDRRTGGFGLHIIRRSVDEINYLSDPKEGNRLILVKYINKEVPSIKNDKKEFTLPGDPKISA